ncbi:MAG: DUF3830 family protein [Proteobacteria bacterium]|nr:DUF3830 family protein [Pseudomonadota bacterium]
MSRRIRISFVKRNVSAIAELQEALAPSVCEAVWEALPREGPVFHAKRSNNEVYMLTQPLASGAEPALENATVFPIPGDVAYFHLPPVKVVNYVKALKEYLPADINASGPQTGLADLGVFYGRNNFLFGPLGPGPGSVFATVVEGLAGLAKACNDVWYFGAAGERLRFSRL